MNNKLKKIKLILLVIITFFIILPLIWMILLSFKDNNEIFANTIKIPQKLNFDNYKRALETLDLLKMYWNTILIVVVSVTIEIFITFLSSYAISRLEFNSKIKNVIYVYLIAGLVIPPFILLFPIYRITILLGLYGTRMSLILPYIATSISFNSLLFIGFLKDFHRELEEAAIIDGCNMVKMWRLVVLPLMKAVMATVIIFNIIYIWNEFPFATTLITEDSHITISLGTSMFKGRFSIDYAGMIAGSLLVIFPQLVIYGFFQRYIIEGLTAGAVKG